MWKIPACLVLSLLVLFLAEAAEGSKEIDAFVRHHLGKELDELKEITSSLEKKLQEISTRKEEFRADSNIMEGFVSTVRDDCVTDELSHHVTYLKSWNFNSCVNLTDACMEGEQVFVEGVELAWNTTQTLGNIGMAILNCPDFNPITAVKCYNKNFGELKNTIYDIKDRLGPYIRESRDVLTKIRYEFDDCLGLPRPSQKFIQGYFDGVHKDCFN